MMDKDSHRDSECIYQKLEAIKELVEESQRLLLESAPNLDELLSTLRAQSGLQQALIDKLLDRVQPTDQERDLSDTFNQAVQELLAYFKERVQLAGKVADAAALGHLRQGR